MMGNSSMTTRLRLLMAVLGVLLIAGCGDSDAPGVKEPAGGRRSLEELVALMPARSVEQGEALFAELAALGPRRLRKLCSQLLPTGAGDDTQVRYALNGLARYVSKPGGEHDRRMAAGVFLDALEDNPEVEVQAFLIQQLQWVGQDESVKPLAAYLTDERLSDPAARTLVAIGTSAAEGVLLDALGEAGGDRQVSLIKALGDLESQDAVPVVSDFAASESRAVRLAALYALGNMGHRSSASILEAAVREAAADEAAEISAYYIRYARRLAEDGRRKQCVNICRELLANPPTSHVRSAALTTLVDVLGDGALDDLMAAMDSDNPALRGTALLLADSIEGRRATGRWADKLKDVTPATRVQILRMLGHRGDGAARSALRKSLRDSDLNVRLTAIEALARLGGADALDDLLDHLEGTEAPEDVAAVKEALLRLPGEDTVGDLAKVLPKAKPRARVVLLEVLAERGATAHKDVVLDQLQDRQENVRLAAIDALGSLGEIEDLPRLLDLIVNATSDAERTVAQRAVIAVANNIEDPELRDDAVLRAMEGATNSTRANLLRVLGRIGGQEALDVVVAATRSTNAAVRDGAIRALTEWPDASAVDALLEVVQTSDNVTHHVLALRGFVRVLEAAELPPGKKIRYLKDALEKSTTLEDKKLIMAGLGNVPALEALALTTIYLRDTELQAEAALAAANIAQGLSGPQVAMGLIGGLVDPEVGDQIQRYLATTLAESGLRRPPDGFAPLFNGRDLAGWEAQADIDTHWTALDGELSFDGAGRRLTTAGEYGDFELLVDWRVDEGGWSGIGLRGTPVVRLADPARSRAGSGGLYVADRRLAAPLERAAYPAGEWNTLRILAVGPSVTVTLNDVLVVDDYRGSWGSDRMDPIVLEAGEGAAAFRNIFIREIPRPRALFAGPLFNGQDLSGWEQVGGQAAAWQVTDGVLYTDGAGGGWLSTAREYGNFRLELEFRVPEGGNSGVFLRAPRVGDPAYAGLEIQVLDDYADKYADLQSWQYTGSIYGVLAPSSRESHKAGRWQSMVIVCEGPQVQVTLNGEGIVDANLIAYMHLEKSHPGLKRRGGYIGLQNHSTRVEYRNIRLTELE